MKQDAGEGKRQAHWFELLDLVRHCPKVVNGVRITSGPRLTLWCLAHHASGDTCRTFVGLGTIAEETGLDERTLKRAVRALKAAKLISATQQMSDDGRWATNNWKIDQDLLRKLVGDGIDEATLRRALDLVRSGDDEVRVTTSPTRLQQTKSRLYHFAGDFQIEIIEEVVGEKFATLVIRPVGVEENQQVDSPPAPEPIAEPEESAADEVVVQRETDMQADPPPSPGDSAIRPGSKPLKAFSNPELEFPLTFTMSDRIIRDLIRNVRLNKKAERCFRRGSPYSNEYLAELGRRVQQIDGSDDNWAVRCVPYGNHDYVLEIARTPTA